MDVPPLLPHTLGHGCWEHRGCIAWTPAHDSSSKGLLTPESRGRTGPEHSTRTMPIQEKVLVGVGTPFLPLTPGARIRGSLGPHSLEPGLP